MPSTRRTCSARCSRCLLLAVLAGVLGSWIVLRRLAFYTHAVGTAAFPGLVVAGAVGRSRRSSPALAARARLRRRARAAARARAASAPDAATGLLLVGALALGVVLASDVFESGAGVDRLLFGIADRAQRPRPVADRGASRRLRRGARRRAAAVVARDRASTRPAPARSGPGPRSPTGCCWSAVAAAAVVALDAVGALLVTVVLVVPAATVRLVAAERARAAGRHRRARRRRGRRRGCWLADALNVGAGPGASRCSAAPCSPPSRAPAVRGDERASRPRPLAAATRPARDVLRGVVVRARAAARSPPCSAPTAAARRRCSARCSASCRSGAARSSSPGRAGVRAADRARAARLPGQRARRRADGRLRAHAVVAAASRAPTARRRGPRSTASASPTGRGARFGDAVRRPAPARADRPRAGAGRAGAAARRAAVGRRRRQRGADRGACFAELRAEGRALLVATHDVEQARRWDRVCACNGGRSRSARPHEVLTPDVLRRTYGAELVVLAGGERAVGGRATTSTDARLADRPVRRRADAARAGRGADPRRSRAGRSACGCCSTGRATRPSRSRTRCCPGSWSPRWRARRCCSAPRAACSRRRSRSRSRGATSGWAATSASRWRSPRCSGSGRCWRSRPRCRRGSASCCSATCSASTGRDLAEAAVLAGGVALALALGHRRLALSAFDRAAAPSLGARPARWELVLLVLLAVCTVAAVHGLGNLLLVALILAPAAAALNVGGAAAGRARRSPPCWRRWRGCSGCSPPTTSRWRRARRSRWLPSWSSSVR